MSCVDRKIFNSAEFTPLSEAKIPAIERSVNIIATIIVLLFHCCPSAVSGFVIPVVINPVYCQSLTPTIRHVRKKCGEVHPSFAYCYPSPSVICIRSARFGATSVFHAFPNLVYRMLGKSVGFNPFGREFGIKASARLGFSTIANASHKNLLRITAIASEISECHISNPLNGNNCQPSIFLPNPVFRVAALVFFGSIYFSHNEPPEFVSVSVRFSTTYRATDANNISQLNDEAKGVFA